MKKVIFCALALMIGTVGLAQTTPFPPTAPPVSPTLPVMGGQPASANRSLTIQNGNGQCVTVSQIGTSQGAYVNQDDGTGTGGNHGLIIQTGNVSPTSGVKNYADLEQLGTANHSTQLQYGDDNMVWTKQGMGIDPGSTNNKALVRQGAPGNQKAEDNMAEVNQDGNNNQSRTIQTVDNNQAYTSQVGNNNYGDIRQNGAPNSSGGHRAEVSQLGNDNDAWINQSGNGATNEATSDQLGSGNYSEQTQTATAAAGMGNNALVSQGDLPRASLNPVGLGLYVTLLGVDNIANGGFNTLATNAEAFQFQNGDDNILVAAQFGDRNYSEQNQDGDDNHALVVQNVAGNPAGNSNYAKQTQKQTNNQAAIGQNGFNHKADQDQNGNFNRAFSTQRGNSNETNINQIGDWNYAETAQRAVNNCALVTQYGGQTAWVQQNLLSGGGGNTADIFQSGPVPGPYIAKGFDAKLLPKVRVTIPTVVCP